MRRCIVDRKIVELLREGQRFNKIAKALKVGKRRIRKLHLLAKEAGYLDGKPLPLYPEAIFPIPTEEKSGAVSDVDAKLLELLGWIQDRREAGWLSITIYEELPIKVERSSFYRFMIRHNLNDPGKFNSNKRVVPEIVSLPGETLQLDWGKLRDVVDPSTGTKKTLWMLIGTMAFSRLMLVYLVWDNKTETTLRVIDKIFKEIGGVPSKIVSDNPKCFSIEASKYEPLLNPAFERFASHYGFIPEILPPRDPKKKGKVERSVPFARRLYQAHGTDWHGLDESQEYINKKVEIANHRVHGTTRLKPIEVFNLQEKEKLKTLPDLQFEPAEYHFGTVRKDGHVRFRNKYYSLEDKHIGKEVFIIGTFHTVSIYHKCQLLETHSRVQNQHLSKSTKNCHRKGWEQIMNDHNYLVNKAKTLGDDVMNIVTQILACGQGYVDYRKIWGILNLDKSYSSIAINEACKKALAMESLSYRTIKNLIEISIPENFEVKTNEKNKFVRPIKEYQTNFIN